MRLRSIVISCTKASTLYGNISDENVDTDVVVIDSSELFADPEKIICPNICKAMGHPYREDMLHFDPIEEACKRWKWLSGDLMKFKNYAKTLMSISKLLPPPPDGTNATRCRST